MIYYLDSDLFFSPAQVLVNTVNTIGVMGKGIAKVFKELYPEMYENYKQQCERHELEVGTLWVYKSENQPQKWVLNFPTKKHWRYRSKVKYIEDGLKRFVENYESEEIESISFPMLGCGNGGLNWARQVRPLMEKYLSALPIDVFIHVPIIDPWRETEEPSVDDIRHAVTSKWRCPPFEEFWDDVKSLAKKEPVLATLRNEVRFDLSLGNCEEAVRIEPNLEAYALKKKSLRPMWNEQSEKGYRVITDFPPDVAENLPAIVSVLQKLRYIQPVWALEPLEDQTMRNGVLIADYLPRTDAEKQLELPI